MTGAPRDKSAWTEAIGVASVGLEMAIAIGLGFFGGDWLDRRYGTAPALMLAGVGLGVVIAGRAVWRTARRYMRESGDGGDERPHDPDA